MPLYPDEHGDGEALAEGRDLLGSQAMEAVRSLRNQAADMMAAAAGIEQRWVAGDWEGLAELGIVRGDTVARMRELEGD